MAEPTGATRRAGGRRQAEDEMTGMTVGALFTELTAMSTTLATSSERIQTMGADIAAIKGLLERQNGRIQTLERTEVACAAVSQRLPERLEQIITRVEELERWKAARGDDVPKRVNELESWRDKAESALGLTKWAVTGGILGILSLLYLVIEVARNRLPLP